MFTNWVNTEVMSNLDTNANLTIGHFVQHKLPWLTLLAMVLSLLGDGTSGQLRWLADDGLNG